MNDHLMPPSHFDPNQRDSLEISRSPSPTHVDETSVRSAAPEEGPFQYVSASEHSRNIHLRPPDDFSPGGWRSQFASDPPQKKYSAPQPGQYETPPTVIRNQGLPVPAIPSRYGLSAPNVGEKYPDLLRLQAENQALKKLIHCKKADVEKSSKDADEPGISCNARDAIIEHLTKHIARLQRDLEEKLSLLAKRDDDATQLKIHLENKEKENKNMADEVARLESIIRAKDDKESSLQQENEGLQKIVQDLGKDKVHLLDTHSKTVKALNENILEEKEKGQVQLKMEMEKADSKYEKARLQWQEAAKKVEEQNRGELVAVHENHEEDRKSLQETMEKKLQMCRQHAEVLEKKLEQSNAKVANFSEVVAEEKSRSEELQSTINALQSEMTSASQQSEKYLAQVKQLQTYIGEQQEEDYERSQWKSHKKKFENHILELQEEKETLNKTLELQTVRLQSITKILTTQEEAIQANAKSFSSTNVRGNPEHVVIRKWREKVFELMIQCKSREISLKEFENKCKLTKADLQERLEEEKRVSVILENQLSECQAQLEMQERENTSLSETNNRLLEQINLKSVKSAQLEEAVVAISENVIGAAGELSKQFHSKFASIVEKNIHLEQRIVFATNRLRTIQDLMVRRDNIWKAKLRRAKEGEPVPPPGSPTPSQVQTVRPELLSEIEKLTGEKDTLSQRLISDSAAFENAMSKFRSREDELEKSISMLQHDVQQKSEEIARLHLQVEKYDEEAKCQERAASDAKENAKRVLENHEKDIELKLSEAWERWDTEKEELEKRLNNAQRELAKAVVTSRQNERNSVRERKQAEEELQVTNSEHQQELEKLCRKIKTLHQDNNLLMTTLRQQGLISAFKAARAQAATMRKDLDAITSDIISHSNASASCSANTSPKKHDPCHSPVQNALSGATRSGHPAAVVPPGQTESISAQSDDKEGVAKMLEDLVVLTEDILGDSD